MSWGFGDGLLVREEGVIGYSLRNGGMDVMRQPDVMDDVVTRGASQKEHEAMEYVIEKLHCPPVPTRVLT